MTYSEPPDPCNTNKAAEKLRKELGRLRFEKDETNTAKKKFRGRERQP